MIFRGGNVKSRIVSVRKTMSEPQGVRQSDKRNRGGPMPAAISRDPKERDPKHVRRRKKTGTYRNPLHRQNEMTEGAVPERHSGREKNGDRILLPRHNRRPHPPRPDPGIPARPAAATAEEENGQSKHETKRKNIFKSYVVPVINDSRLLHTADDAAGIHSGSA